MIQGWLQLSMEMRLTIILTVGILLSPFINWAIYNVAYFPLPISPWRRLRFREMIRKHFEEVARQSATTAKTSKPKNPKSSSPESAQNPNRFTVDEAALLNPSRWSRIPIIGWLFLRKESIVFGNGFWIRPMLIEILFPIFLAWLYRFEIEGGLLPPAAIPVAPTMLVSLNVQYFSHAVLCCFMCVATFIDFDERTIPDWVTIPGTLIGLLLTTLGSFVAPIHLWTNAVDVKNKSWPIELSWTSPYQVGDSISSAEQLFLGLLSYSIWCFALADRRLILRRGIRKAIDYFFAGLVRRPAWKWNLGIAVAGLSLITLAWGTLSDHAWQTCLTSLVGMALGGMLVWVVRVVATTAIGMEALGFGDVTLMFMVGAFLGWQPAWIAFFVAPMVAILIVLVMFFITGDNQLPFGPYLCAGTIVTLLAWDPLWNVRLQGLIQVIGFELFILLAMGLLMMGLMLWAWRMIKLRFQS